MSTADEERSYWDAQTTSFESAKGAIAADESAWSGDVLEACLDQILPALDAAPRRKGHGPRVLDLGCGAGRLTIPIARRRSEFEMAGVDVSQGMLDLALAHTAALELTKGVSAAQRIRWIPCDGRNLPADLGRIDAAYSMITMQHIPWEGQKRYIEQIGEQLVRGGVFCFQNLEGGETSFLNHYFNEQWIREVCDEIGTLKITAIDRVRPFGGNPDAPNAIWVTAVKK